MLVVALHLSVTGSSQKGGGLGERVDEDQNAIRVCAEVDLLLRQISHHVVDCRPAPRRQVDRITACPSSCDRTFALDSASLDLKTN